MSSQTSPIASSDELAYDKLTILALDGKLKAISGYDDIIWKIRAGYIAILYGLPALILGTEGIPDIQKIISNKLQSAIIILLLIGFSISSYIVDGTYLKKKVKVITSRNMLMRIAIEKKFDGNNDFPTLLLISGELQPKDMPKEALAEFKVMFAANRRQELLPIYGVPPLLVVLIYGIVLLTS